MKKILFALFWLTLGMSSCLVVDEESVPEITNSGYTLKISGGTVKADSTIFQLGDIATVEVVDKTNKKVAIEVDFGNGPLITGETATYKYPQAGVYKITAKVKNLTPEVKLSTNAVVKNKPVDPLKGENVRIVLDSSYVNGVNTITYGLRLDIADLDNSPIFVEASVPGKEWSVYTNATEIIVKNGFKYVKWTVIGGNGTVRAGWYQYHMVNGINTKVWAVTSTSKYWNAGLPEWIVKDGATYVLGTNSSVYSLQFDGVSVSNDTARVNLNTAFTAKVMDQSGNVVPADISFSGGSTFPNSSGASASYATAGTYLVTATIKSVTPNKVLTKYIVASKKVVPVYTLKVGTDTYASGSVIKIVEGASLTFKLLNSAGNAELCTYTLTGATPVVADSKTAVYPTAGTYDVKIETVSDATIITAKVEVSKPVVPNYILKVGTDTFASGSTIKITKGTSLTFKVIDSNTGNAVSSTYTITGSSPVVALSKTVTYSTNGTFDVRIVTETDLKVFTATVEVTDPPVKAYVLKIDNQAVTNGSTVKLTKNTAAYFKVYDDAGLVVVAKLSFGEGTVVNTDGRAFTYSAVGTYQFQAEVGGAVIKATIEVAEPVVPVYTLKINGQVVANGATYKTTEKVSLALKTVNADGVTEVVTYNFGDNTSETTDNAAKVYNTAGTYRITISKGSATLQTANIEVAPLAKPDTYSFRINNLDISSETAYLVEGALTSIKVVDKDAIPVMAEINFGDGSPKVTSKDASHSYAVGIYTLSASIGDKAISKRIEVTKPVDPVKPESVILISSSISGTTINAVLGLRCNAINSFSSAKTTYVAGEIPGVNWMDYPLSEIVTIDGVKYFKWSVSAPAGSYRMSWVQMRDGVTELYKGHWANDLNSMYWNVSEGLFLFKLSIDGNTVKLTK